MNKHKEYLIETDFFNRSWTWIKRAIICSIIWTIIFLWGEVYPEYISGKYLFLLFTTLVVFAIPKDDLVVDSRKLYYIKKSVIPFFSTVREFEISEIKFIKGTGTYTRGFELFDLATFGNIYQSLNSLEIAFKNDSSVKFKVGIYKNELDSIVLKVKELLK